MRSSKSDINQIKKFVEPGASIVSVRSSGNKNKTSPIQKVAQVAKRSYVSSLVVVAAMSAGLVHGAMKSPYHDGVDASTAAMKVGHVLAEKFDVKPAHETLKDRFMNMEFPVERPSLKDRFGDFSDFDAMSANTERLLNNKLAVKPAYTLLMSAEKVQQFDIEAKMGFVDWFNKHNIATPGVMKALQNAGVIRVSGQYIDTGRSNSIEFMPPQDLRTLIVETARLMGGDIKGAVATIERGLPLHLQNIEICDGVETVGCEVVEIEFPLQPPGTTLNGGYVIYDGYAGSMWLENKAGSIIAEVPLELSGDVNDLASADIKDFDERWPGNDFRSTHLDF